MPKVTFQRMAGSALIAFFLCCFSWTSGAAAAESLSVKGAAELLKEKKAEELFLQYGSASPDKFSEKDRKSLADILRKGAALAKDDDFIAHGLLSRSVSLDENDAVLFQLAEVEIRLGQRGGALEHLRRALEVNPKSGNSALLLGIMLFEDRDLAGSEKALIRAESLKVPKASEWLAKVRAAHAQNQKEEAEFQRKEAELRNKLDIARRAAVRDWLAKASAEAAKDDLAPGGIRKMQSTHFAFHYTADHKTMVEIHQFDGRIERILEHAYDHVSKLLDMELDRKIPVSLLTEEEYKARYKEGGLSRAGGFWNGREIVLNGQTSVDENFVRIMVHELTHAFVHAIIGPRSQIPTWSNEGLADYSASCAIRDGCQMARRSVQLVANFKKLPDHPDLLGLTPAFREMGPNVSVAYAVSEAAVSHLIQKKGMKAYVAALKEMRTLRSPMLFDKALKKHLGVTTAELEKEMGL